MTLDEADAVLEHLPPTDRLILSGGEPLVERELLLHILGGAARKYGSTTGLAVQTNGDLLDGDALDDIVRVATRVHAA